MQARTFGRENALHEAEADRLTVQTTVPADHN
jgi:hypothetical protein